MLSITFQTEILFEFTTVRVHEYVLLSLTGVTTYFMPGRTQKPKKSVGKAGSPPAADTPEAGPSRLPVPEEDFDETKSGSEHDDDDNDEEEDEDDEEEQSQDGFVEGMDPGGFIGEKTLKPLTPEALAAFKAAQDRAGVIYISRIPPGMRPPKVRHLMSNYGAVGRVYLQQEGMQFIYYDRVFLQLSSLIFVRCQARLPTAQIHIHQESSLY